MKSLSLWFVGLSCFCLFLLCCLLFGLSGGLVYWGAQLTSGEVLPEWFPSPTVTPQLLRSTDERLVRLAAEETLETLRNTMVPVSDMRDLAHRLEGKENIPLTVLPPATPLQVGDRESFWVMDVDTNESFQVAAVLQSITDHLYFWVEEGIKVNPDELQALTEAFEQRIHPTNRALFGSEWTPGVDGDPHLYVLYARGLGLSVAGTFSSADEMHPLAHEYSNAHEMFLLSADNVDLDERFTFGVLAHEFQHMIHWYQDRNETTWLNEGFSELAALINGYYEGGFDGLYTGNPDVQLNDWPLNPEETPPHYGAAFLFVTYFLDRFGEEATRALVAHPNDGLESIDRVLFDLGVVNPETGAALTADEVFMDWTVANYLQDAQVADGRYAYSSYSPARQAQSTETISYCPSESITRSVYQYGVDYLSITCEGQYTLRFEGGLVVPLTPAEPHSGDMAFWSNKGDESDMSLTRTFDFSDHQGPLTLTYWTWYDLEENYDYLYVEASLDGEHWQILKTPSGTEDDPSGNSYGWGYNGVSGRADQGPVWIYESVDLTPFNGHLVQIRFEYVTDAAVHGEGFWLDDVSIPEIGYFTDFEADDGGWEAAGFVRVQSKLPQTFALQLITLGETTTVQRLVPVDNFLEVPISIGGEVRGVVLVVSGTTRFTRQPAIYQVNIVPSE